jgi:methyl-accepting chemotaxis protein
MARTYRRRNYLTKKAFQARFILPFFAAASLANIIAVIVFIILARRRIDDLLFSMYLPPVTAGALLSPAAFIAGGVAVVGVIILLLWAARGMYNKISAPLHMIRNDLQKIGTGDLSFKVTLRDIDEFKDFADEVNTMTGELKLRFTRLKVQADELVRASDKLKASQNPAESLALREEMKGLIRAMQEQIGAFKI